MIVAWVVGVALLVVTLAADQRAERFTLDASVRHELGYLISLPEGYEGADERAPLLLFLHGAGERGDDLERVKKWGPPRLCEQDARWRASFPAIVVSPQCPEGELWDADTLLALLDHVEATHRVDADRIYVTGLSMGGYGTWSLADAAPGRFAAIAPVCGGYTYANIAAGRRLGDTPIWAFHGEDDDVIPVSESVDAIKSLRAQGADPDRVRLTTYPGVGHDSWRQAYATDELWAWMLEQRRGR